MPCTYAGKMWRCADRRDGNGDDVLHVAGITCTYGGPRNFGHLYMLRLGIAVRLHRNTRTRSIVAWFQPSRKRTCIRITLYKWHLMHHGSKYFVRRELRQHCLRQPTVNVGRAIVTLLWFDCQGESPLSVGDSRTPRQGVTK